MHAEQAQLAALDDQYQSKVLSEIQRYEALVRDKHALNAQWDEQTKKLVERHDQLVQEVTDDLNAKLQVIPYFSKHPVLVLAKDTQENVPAQIPKFRELV